MVTMDDVAAPNVTGKPGGGAVKAARTAHQGMSLFLTATNVRKFWFNQLVVNLGVGLYRLLYKVRKTYEL